MREVRSATFRRSEGPTLRRFPFSEVSRAAISSTDNCKWLGKPKCTNCGWFGHIATECWKQQFDNNRGESGRSAKRERAMQAVEVENDREITFSAKECQDNLMRGNENVLYLYDWLADSATTSHIVNLRGAFHTFAPLRKTINGVGDKQIYAEGKGTVKIVSIVTGQKFYLTLTDVLYVPKNPNNLLSLGRWDTASDSYHGGNNTLQLHKDDGTTVVIGTTHSTQRPPHKAGSVAETALIKDLAARARGRMDGKGDNPMRILLVHQ